MPEKAIRPLGQHALCTPLLQRKFFEYVAKAAESDDVPMKQVTLLTDRIRFNEGKPQIYGTVLACSGKRSSRPCFGGRVHS